MKSNFTPTNICFEKNPKVPEGSMLVRDWFWFWHDNIIYDLAFNTKRNYERYFRINVAPVIGDMNIQDVKPYHLRLIFNGMTTNYSTTTIQQAYIFTGTLFRSAKANDVIETNPMLEVKLAKQSKFPTDIRFLTEHEQKKFLIAAQDSPRYDLYCFTLFTGLRASEIIGLTWDCIDWRRHVICIKKNLCYNPERHEWVANPTKSMSGYREIFVTSEAYAILRKLYKQRNTRNMDMKNLVELSYYDRKSGKIKTFHMKDLVFLNEKTGMPDRTSNLDSHLRRLAKKIGTEPFGMHALRHTFATRAIESKMTPKVLQAILGHSSLAMTMDRYVHVTNMALSKEMRQFEKSVKPLFPNHEEK